MTGPQQRTIERQPHRLLIPEFIAVQITDAQEVKEKRFRNYKKAYEYICERWGSGIMPYVRPEPISEKYRR